MNVTQKLLDYLEKDINRTFAVSLAFHILLLVTFLMINIGFEFNPPDFAEIAFVSGEPLLTGSPPAGMRGEAREELLQGTPERLPADQVKEEEIVRIPARRMLEDEEPQLTSRKIEKQKIADTPAVDLTKKGAAIEELPKTDERARIEKITPGATRMDLADKDIPTTGAGTRGETELPFKIEGEAAQRRILYKVIPEYPAGLQSEATVKVQFSVLADGSVGKMMPIIKGNAVLENLTLKALREWRFNPLPATAAQREVDGIITFRYILR